MFGGPPWANGLIFRRQICRILLLQEGAYFPEITEIFDKNCWIFFLKVKFGFLKMLPHVGCLLFRHSFSKFLNPEPAETYPENFVSFDSQSSDFTETIYFTIFDFFIF